MFRQNGVGNKAPAGKLVEILARINLPVHLLEQICSVHHAALREADRVAWSRSEGGLDLQEI